MTNTECQKVGCKRQDTQKCYLNAAGGYQLRCPDHLTKLGADLEVGDVIFGLSHDPHRIARFDDYVHPIVTEGETWRIARCSDGWDITVPPTSRWEIG